MPVKLLERSEYLKQFESPQQMGEHEEQKDSDIVIAVRKGFSAIEVKQVSDHTLRFAISDGSLDRENDTINVNGWRLDNYKRNPVVLFGHDHWNPPIAKAVSIGVENATLISDAEFTPADVSAFGDMIYRMYQGGFMNAVSVGFIPDERVWSDEQNGIKFLTQELIEYSAVPVPANPNALQIARSKGIDVSPLKDWAVQLLDEWKDGNRSVGASRKQLERMLKAADDKNTVTSLPSPGIEVPEEKQKELRLRNIWEPRLKTLHEDNVWEDSYGPRPGEEGCEVPKFLVEEYSVQVEREIDKYKQEVKDYAEKLANESPHMVELATLCGVELYELTLSLGMEAMDFIDSFQLGDSAELAEAKQRIAELEEELKEIDGLLQKLPELSGKSEGVETSDEELRKQLEAMTEERDALLLQLAEVLVEQQPKSGQGVDPAKLARMIGEGVANAVRNITGQVG